MKGLIVAALVALTTACTPPQTEPPASTGQVTNRPAHTAWPAASATPRPTTTLTPTPVPTVTTPVTVTPTVRPPTPSRTATLPPSPSPSPLPPSPTPTQGPTPDGTARELRVPILMYHYVSDAPPGSDIYRQDLSVSPERFAQHLRYLKEAGYVTITLDDLLYALVQGKELPEKPVILTFDDGYVDNHAHAFPLLREQGMVGTFFILTDFASQGRAEYLTWPQIEEMAEGGMRFGSHSRDHPDLRNKSTDYLVWQALGGKEAIEEHLGYHPRWIAYPSGGYDERTIAVYRSAGYWGGLTTKQGATHSSDAPFELRRVRVRGTHTAQDLAALLQLDW